MSGGSKKKFKQYEIKSIQDACVVMLELISQVSRNFSKYQEYAWEAGELYIKNRDKKTVSGKEYEDINDKLLFRQHELLMYIADRQSSSFSYIDFRELLIKKNYLELQLDEELRHILNDLLDIRNWSFHNTQSILVAENEAMKRNLPTEMKAFVSVQPLLNPVYIPKVISYEIEYLASLVMHTKRRMEMYEKVLRAMKNDYEILYEKLNAGKIIIGLNKVVYPIREVHATIKGPNIDAVQISMAIQKSKYDGTDESYDRWTLK